MCLYVYECALLERWVYVLCYVSCISFFLPICYTCVDDKIVANALKSCKKGTAFWYDNVYYGNIKYDGDLLVKTQARLFNALLDVSNTPTDMKKGNTTTLFKVNGHRKYITQANARASVDQQLCRFSIC